MLNKMICHWHEKTRRKQYDSDLAGAHRSVREPMLPPPNQRGRPRKTDLREVVNAIIPALGSGRSWRTPPRPAAVRLAKNSDA